MSRHPPLRSLLLASVLLCAGCSITLVIGSGTTDAGGITPGGSDSGTADSGNTDSGSTDSGTADSGSSDAGSLDSGTPDAGTADAGRSDAGTSDAGTSDAGTPDAGRTDAGSPDAGTPDAGTPGGGVTAVVDSAAASVTGPRGQDLTVSFSAHDPAKRIAAVMVRIGDTRGAPIIGFDSHQSGILDLDVGPATPSMAMLGLATVNATATIEGLVSRLAASPGSPVVGTVWVSLRDAAGGISNEVPATVLDQPVKQSGSCDPASLLDRCDVAQGCTGAPPTCQVVTPDVTRVAYLRADGGAVFVIAGSAPGDEIAAVHIDFEDADGGPKNVVFDPSDPANSMHSFADVPAGGSTYKGLFLVSRTLALPGFDLQCPQIKVTATDTRGTAGVTQLALPKDLTVRSAGATCDLLGFDQCAAGSVCMPGATNTCQPLTTAQTTRCASVPTLSPTASAPATTFGHTASPSLWDAPSGCAPQNPVGRPEGVVKLVVAQPTALLTLSVDNPGTDFDTTVYLLPGSPPTSTARSLGCNELGASPALFVQNVPAGTYTVVVDSFKPHGGNFQLTATVQ
jgi:hypothetical protein